MNRRQRERKRKQNQPKPEPQYGAGVGLILGIMHNGVPRLPAMQAWRRAVPKEARRATRWRRVA